MAGRAGKSEPTGALTALAQKRIARERHIIEQERGELESCGIFTHWGDEVHKAPGRPPWERRCQLLDVLLRACLHHRCGAHVQLNRITGGLIAASPALELRVDTAHIWLFWGGNSLGDLQE